MAKNVNFAIDDAVALRKEKTELSYLQLFMIGLESAELKQKENKIDMREGAETVG